MKTRKNIYLAVGIILILLNLIVDIAEFETYRSMMQSTGYTIGYFIGSHIFLFAGIVLLRQAYKTQRRIKENEVRKMINDIGSD